ncbi:cytochrome P450 [Cutibacterium avidum]|nr:cytochrome P450 [Cutibacterium avidum]
MDDPEHTRLRSLIATEFSARSMQQMHPQVAQRAHELIGLLGRGEAFDFVHEVAQPYPLMVMSDFLGIRPEYRAHLLEAAKETLTTTNGNAQRSEALAGVATFLCPLLARSVHDESAVGRLARKEGASEDEKAGVLAQVLIAGYVVPSNFLAQALLTLLQEEALDGYATTADADATTQELLRFIAFESRPRMRYAAAAHRVSATTIQKDQCVAVALEEANRDPKRWDQADVFNPHRERQANMAFGHGPHQCLGQSLARLEITAVFTELFRRFPRLALDASHPVEFSNSSVTKDLVALWVVDHA